MKKPIKILVIAVLALSQVSCSGLLADLGLESSGAYSSFDRDQQDCAELDEGCEGSNSNQVAASDGMEDQASERAPASTRYNRIRQAVENNDVVVGMTPSQVIDSWGNPTVREVAGNGESGHERWTYGSRSAPRGSRYLIFESGRVVGWHR